MYEYKYIEIKARMGFSSHFKGFEEIIDEEALRGWRFVATIPVKSYGQMGVTVLSLVFERKKE